MEVGRLGQAPREQAAHRHVEEVTGDGGPNAGSLHPRGHRARVPCLRSFRRPRGVEGNELGGPVQPSLGERDGGDGEGADLRDEPPVAQQPTVVDEEVGTVDPGLVGGHAEVAGEPEHRLVSRREPRSATVHRRAVGQVLGPDSAADPGDALRGRPPTCRPGAAAALPTARRSRHPPHTHRRRSVRAFGLHRNPGPCASASPPPPSPAVTRSAAASPPPSPAVIPGPQGGEGQLAKRVATLLWNSPSASSGRQPVRA